MSLTFAGQPLILPDPQGQLGRYLDNWLPPEDLHLFGEPLGLTGTRTNPRGDQLQRVGMPWANWPPPPRVKINSLWWPTGASRWARGLFLVAETQLDSIRSSLGTGTAGTLSIGDGTRTVTASLHMLSPRRLSAVSSGGVWLLPLVDERYFWQFRDAGLLVVDTQYTWGRLFSHLAGRLGVSLDPGSVASGYAQPDPEEFTRRYENAAVLLDAAAWCIGKRVVRQLDGTVSLNGSEAAASETTSNVSAGGWHTHRHAQQPAEVRVVFPKWRDGKIQADGDVYYISKAPPDSTAAMPSGTIKTFFDTAWANFSSGGSTPDNFSEINALAEQIATDYYAWASQCYDLSFAGVQSWEITGHDDFVWYHAGHQPVFGAQPAEADIEADDPRWQFYTRVATLPYNWGYSELLHYVDTEVSSSSSSLSSSSSSSSGVSSSSSSGGSSTSSSASASSSSSSSSGTSASSVSDLSSGECIDPLDVGLPAPPDGGKYVLGVEANCLIWIAVEEC
ncbi:MAG: hypothetical protein ABFD92_21420 [Planctomycetaceae bacterium]